jgi:hypothetical protein
VWNEKLSREAGNPRLSISLAVGNLNIDEYDKKDKKENGDSNEKLLSVCSLEKKDLNGI